MTSRTSLEKRLPAVLTTFLAVVLVAFAVAEYLRVRDAFMKVAERRIQASGRQLANLLGQQSGELLRLGAARAQSPAVLAFVQNPGPATRAAAEKELTAAAQRTLGGAIEVRPEKGEPLVIGNTDLVKLWAAKARPLAPGVGPFWVEDTVIAYAVMLPIEKDGARLGTLIEHRRANSSSGGGAAVISQLIGDDSRFLIGDSAGVWMDLEKTAQAPPAHTGSNLVEYDSPEGARLGAAFPLRNTPWFVWIDLSRSVVMNPVLALMRQLAIALVVLLVVVAVVTWYVGRRVVTGPLHDLAVAFRGVEQGNYAERVHTKRNDELGMLAQSFNSMADKVQRSHDELEAHVEARTRELKNALMELENAQDTLVRKERLAMLGQLASSVGHELRNPLGVMTNAIYVVEAVQPDAPQMVKDYYGILRAQISLSERIVSDLLDFARNRQPQLERVSVAGVVRQQIERAGTMPASIELEVDIPDDIPEVIADPVQIGQIVLNLISNAQQAMEENGGVLRISAREEDDGRVVISVADTGKGIQPENMQRIFEPLFTTKPRGIGLGLAVSRQLAAGNGGDLQVESTYGEGATFKLTLRAAEVPVAA